MERMSAQLEALARICRQLGGQLVVLSRSAFFTLLDTKSVVVPFSEGSRFEYGIQWKKKIIYAVRGTKHIGYVIHEAGHVFADRYHPDNAKCDEWAWFGWEIAVARRIGAWNAWSEQNGHYFLGDGIEGGIGKDKSWWQLSASERRAVVADRIAHAKKISLLSTRSAPRSLR